MSIHQKWNIMAKINLPTSDNARSQLIQKCLHNESQIEDDSQRLLPADIIERGTALLSPYNSKLNAIGSLLSTRSIEVQEKKAAMNRLTTYLRDYWEVLRRRTNRLDHPVQVLTFYQLPLDGNTPPISREKDLLNIANRAIEGDTQAVNAGYPAMVNPTAAEVKEVLDVAWKEVNDVPPADRAYDQALESIADLRAQADELIRDIHDYLNFVLRKKDAASRRRIIQTYGFSYTYQKGEGTTKEVSAN